MRATLVPVLFVLSGLIVLPAFLGCGFQDRPTLDAALPETRERMQMVMKKIGRYYEQLAESVDTGNLAAAPTPAEAIARLGAYIAPYRDPGVPEQYVVLQAQFDEASRELAAAARLRSLHEVSELFREMQQTCRNCHATFRVSLEAPLEKLGTVAR
jgi:Cytochrome C'